MCWCWTYLIVWRYSWPLQLSICFQECIVTSVKNMIFFLNQALLICLVRYKIARNFVKKQLPILSSEPIVVVTKYSQADVRLYWFVFHQSTIDQHFDRIRMLLRSLTFNVPLFFPFCYLSQLTYTGYVRSWWSTPAEREPFAERWTSQSTSFAHSQTCYPHLPCLP